MRYKDMTSAVQLLENNWDLGEKECGASRRLCAWIYLFEILEEAEQVVCYRKDKKLLGFASYANYNSTRHLLRKKFYSFIKRQLYKSKEIKDLNALKEYEENYWYIPKEMENSFDGEMSMLIVDDNIKGKGIGKKLLNEIFRLAKNDGMKNIFILSDESCNYRFYEHMGCKKVYETIIENREYGKLNGKICERAFIYEKQL